MKAIDIFLELQRISQENREYGVESELERACLEVEFFTFPQSPVGAIERVAQEVARREAANEGKLTASYPTAGDVEGGTRSAARRDRRLDALCKLDEIEQRLVRALSRGRIRTYAEKHGFGGYLHALAGRCLVCRSDLAIQLQLLRDDGWSLRQLSFWTRKQKQPFSKDQLQRHFDHVDGSKCDIPATAETA